MAHPPDSGRAGRGWAIVTGVAQRPGRGALREWEGSGHTGGGNHRRPERRVGGQHVAVAVATTSSTAPNAEREEILSYVNTLSLHASGAVDTTLRIQGEDLTLTGGCTGSSPISLGFRKGRPDEDDYLSLSFDTRDVVAPGQAGAFVLEEITWDDGTSVITLPAGTEIRGPNRLTGPGSLTLDVHRTEVGDRRMAGTVRGDVKGDEGHPVELVAEFSVNLACGSR